MTAAIVIYALMTLLVIILAAFVSSLFYVIFIILFHKILKPLIEKFFDMDI